MTARVPKGFHKRGHRSAAPRATHSMIVTLRSFSFEKSPAALGVLRGNRLVFYLLVKLNHFFLKLGKASLTCSEFIHQLARFLFEQEDPVPQDRA